MYLRDYKPLQRLMLIPLLLTSICVGAAEGGKSLYLLGKRGPLAGLIPKAGVYLENDVYHYSGQFSGGVPIAGGIHGDIDANVLVNILQATWVDDADILDGGRLALGAVLPYGRVEVDASGTATLPAGMALEAGREDRITAFGDPALAAALGWKHRDGDEFRAWNVYSTLFVPIGSYSVDRIANMGANRWGLDVGTAFTAANFKRGREFSGVLGVTVNGENDDTNYRSGTDLHLELVYKQHLPSGLGVGIAGYYYHQLSDDSGSALLGGFKGRVTGVGPELSYQFKVAGKSFGAELRWYKEFNAQNRLEGDAAFLTLSTAL